MTASTPLHPPAPSWEECMEILDQLPALPVEERIVALERLVRNPSPGIRERALRIGSALLSDDQLISYLRDDADAALRNAGLEIFKRVIEAQGGDPRVCDDTRLLPHAAKRREIRAESGGFLAKAACRAIGEASMLLGAGRDTVADAVDPGVGIVLGRKVGDAVDRGDVLATLHYNEEPRLERALARLSGAFVVSTDPVARPALVLKVIE